MPEKHVSSQFDHELNSVAGRIMEMGGLVESQIKFAIDALSNLDSAAAAQIARLEERVNELDVEIDAELSTIIATRQPTAKDLRLLLGISKATSNLERIGDEANKIGRMVQTIINEGAPRNLPILELRYSGELAAAQLRSALDAFARMDLDSVVSILRQDDLIDKEFEGYTRKLVTYMMEDPRKISISLEMLFLAKSIERIGDHAKNLAELVVYMVKGKDVRHTSVEHVESTLKQGD
ncbi:phosphate transport system protein [Lampropedia hyalina DSM 16112]|jgi:phosphate transport system protein|uniref:Phosphate-specific transport system accessory protein PhoU n=1 Tax=Lampropedia hyalina DSM 16112 TaxID=1122156 RepID=A0A1M4YBZ6_9BURK|nr:phosphate signaling complex protein PhoU [Lampropedia hyalina]SHF03128.1 phosphate transport system protein [Lampropedia hyalina DSM 16112]